MMKTFRLQSHSEFGRGGVLFNCMPLLPAASQRLRNHSPDGFAWGYNGSGPSQLALAVLLKAGVSERETLAFYGSFRQEHIANLGDGPFDVEINLGNWIDSARRSAVPRLPNWHPAAEE